MGLLTQEGTNGSGELGRTLERLREAVLSRHSLLARLYRMRFTSALIIVLPVLFLSGWYAAAAYTSHVRYVSAAGLEEPLTTELFQTHLHDRLTRDLRRLTMPDPPGDTGLPAYAIVIGNAELDTLDRNVPPEEGPASYVDAYLKKGRMVKKVRVRYRGHKHWHWNHPQKSWKVRAAAGEFLDGLDVFSFINTPEPLPIDEQIVMDVARELGLLTPQYFPFRLQVNNAYMGVYFLSAQPDEGLLRNERRMPGSIYSGNCGPADEKTGVSTLWKDVRNWKKLASRFPDQASDLSELEALLESVDTGSQKQFATFARDHIDVEKFALFDALDVVFGSNQHDFASNHKIYFDPYRGRFEPIAWNFRGWKHRKQLNRTENPLLIRLKDLPEYITIRNRIVHELLDGTCSPEAVRKRAGDLLEALHRDQASDPYWDAYQLFPQVSRYHRQMVRPMTFERQDVILESRMSMFEIRALFIADELRDVTIEADLFAETLAVPDPAVDDTELGLEYQSVLPTFLDVVVDGRSGIGLETLKASWDPRCRPSFMQIYADTNLSDVLEPQGDRVLTPRLHPDAPADLDTDVFPGSMLKEKKKVHPRRGAVRAKPEARRYRLFIRTDGCAPRSVEIQGTNLVSGEEIELSVPLAPGKAAIEPHSCEEGPYAMDGSHSSLHPWCLEPPVEEEIHIGPGIVNVEKTRVYGPGQRVVIEPGTTLAMGEDASLIFRGRVRAEGFPGAPIVFAPAGKSWGGIALQGPGTAGSRLRRLHVTGGTAPAWHMVSFPGMVNVHDTHDVVIRESTFGRNSVSDEVLHAAFTTDLAIEECDFTDAFADAVDLEFCEAKLEELRVVGAGDECVDLMGSKVKLKDSILVDCGASCISAGEETEIEVKRTLVVGGARGLLVKNASKARLEKVLFHASATALHVVPASDRYDGKSGVKAKKLHAVGCKDVSKVEGGKLKGVEKIVTTLGKGDLKKLRRDVLHIDDWSALDGFLEKLRKELGP
jgi:hypothetical protein